VALNTITITSVVIKDRPFNLKGEGGYGFLFRSDFFFSDNTRVRIYIFFGRAKREIFFQNLTLGYITKTLNQIIFFFLHQNQNIFFSNIGNQNIFLEKKHTPPPPLLFKLNGRSLRVLFMVQKSNLASR
jgi:hypothetical protein